MAGIWHLWMAAQQMNVLRSIYHAFKYICLSFKIHIHIVVIAIVIAIM